MALTADMMRDAFRLMDAHNRGWLPAADVSQLVNSIGFHGLSAQEHEALIKAMDPGATGRIEFAEYERVVLRRQVAPGSPEELHEALDVLDPTHSGLAKSDLAAAAEACGVQVSQATLNEMFASAADSSPTMSTEHWRAAINKLQASGRKATKQ